MKRKAIIGLITAIVVLQIGVSATEIKSYGKDKDDNQYFVEQESVITLDANGGYIGYGHVGTETEIDVLTEKGRIKLPMPYRNSDYEFEGWFTEDGDKVSSDTEYYTDATLTAKWNIVGERIITFSSDGGSDILPITAKYGEKVNIDPLIPIKQGFVFKGWYIDPRTKENRVTEITLVDNVTVYAKWEQVSNAVNVIGKDPIYMTDEEIAMKKQILQSQYKPMFTNEQITRLIRLLQQMLNKAE